MKRIGKNRLSPVILVVKLLGVILLAWVAGFASVVGTAVMSARPAVFLAVGLVVTAGIGGAGFWWVLRRWPRPSRALATLIGLGLLMVATFVELNVPLSDPRPGPVPVPGSSYWQLDTGSRLAYVKLPGTAPTRPTPIVVLHGGPGIPDMAGDATFFGQLTDLGFDVYVYDQLGSGRSTRLPDPAGYGIDRDVADLEQIRRAIGAPQMVLFGHSYGGALAAHYAAAHPDRVAKLILSSPGPIDPADHSGDRATAGLDE